MPLTRSGRLASGSRFPLYLTFNQSVQVTGGTAGHVYQYTASLFNANGQVASINQSDPFILL